MAALLFLFLLGEHSWFAFSNLKEKHPLSFLRRNDGGRISSGCQPCGRHHLSRAPAPDARRARLAASRVYAQRLRCTEISGSLSIASV